MAQAQKTASVPKKKTKPKMTFGNTDAIMYPPSQNNLPVGTQFSVMGSAAINTTQVTGSLQAGGAGASGVNVTCYNLGQSGASWQSDNITLSQPGTQYTFTATFTHDGSGQTQQSNTYGTANNSFHLQKDHIAFPPSGLIFPGEQFNVVGFASPKTTKVEAFILYRGMLGKERCKRLKVTFRNPGQPNACWLTPVLKFTKEKTIYTVLVIFHHGKGLAGSATRVYQTLKAPGSRRPLVLRKKG